jgi:hypothetical protein
MPEPHANIHTFFSPEADLTRIDRMPSAQASRPLCIVAHRL